MLRWAVQTNLGKASDIDCLLAACRRLQLATEELKHIPFSAELPDLDTETPTIFYGATQFVNLIAANGGWTPGVFFDEAQFQFSRCRSELGDRLLNAQARLTTLAELLTEPSPDSLELFIRPAGDNKEFAGDIQTLGAIKRWVEGLDSEEMFLHPDCPVIVAEPVGLAYEWRVFMIGGRAVTGSQYRRHHRLKVEAGLPDPVVEFAEETARIFSPAEVFVIDVARSGEALFVVEYNCFNSSGFYASDIPAIVRSINEFHEAKSTRVRADPE
jgi:ATP-grasp domain-containing protein